MNGWDVSASPHCWTARNLSPALVYKLNTLLCLLSLISRMHSRLATWFFCFFPFFSLSLVKRLQTCQGTVTAWKPLAFFLQSWLVRLAGQRQSRKNRKIGQDISQGCYPKQCLVQIFCPLLFHGTSANFKMLLEFSGILFLKAVNNCAKTSYGNVSCVFPFNTLSQYFLKNIPTAWCWY